MFTLVGALALTAPASARPPSDLDARDSLEVYVGTVNADQLRGAGVDLDHQETDGAANTTIETVLSKRQAVRLASQGVNLDVKKVRGKGASEALRENGANDWARSRQTFSEGAAVVTDDTVYLGFGLEGLAPAARDGLVARSLAHLTGRPRQ